jgi:hypothetical protein
VLYGQIGLTKGFHMKRCPVAHSCLPAGYHRILVLILVSCFLQDGKAQFFRFSEGLYRVPYENNQTINMGSDVWTHNPLGKYDMWADNADKKIVAAADGWIRGIQESFDTMCFVNNGGMITCCWQLNNYVIMQHPNGEWSGYTHIKVGSATDQGISLNQWVTAGTAIGVEGSVGCSTGRHLHWEVSRPADPSNGFQAVGGFLNGELLIPVICGIGTSQPWFVQGNTYTSGPCDDDCVTNVTVSAGLSNGEEYVARADNSVLTSTVDPVVFASGSASQFRSGNYIRMRPGFRARSGSKFEALLKDCNEQE